VVENTTGAAGIIGVNRVATPRPTLTFLLAASAPMPTIAIYKKPRLRRRRRFRAGRPVRRAALSRCAQGSSAGSLPEFIAYAKAKSGKMHRSAGGRHGRRTLVACFSTRRSASASRMFLSRRGDRLPRFDRRADRLHVRQHRRASPLSLGKACEAIATLTRDRSPILPDLATAHEQGLIDFYVNTWNAFFSSESTPAAIVRSSSEATSQAMAPACRAGCATRRDRCRSRAAVAGIPRQVRRR